MNIENLIMAEYKILVVDDEEVLCDILKFNLEVEGYGVDTAFSAEDALKMNLTEYNLILLDVMMGEMSGFRMAQILKSHAETASIPIIFCTAKDTENDTVAGLTIGADDYIAKPFSVREVIARVKAVLRRTEKEAQPNRQNPDSSTCFETLRIDNGKKQCTVDGVPVQLTKKEFEILSLFIAHKGTIFSREDILHRIWSDDVVVVDRTIDVAITRLRKKIGIYGQNIVTRHGYGYGFEA